MAVVNTTECMSQDVLNVLQCYLSCIDCVLFVSGVGDDRHCAVCGASWRRQTVHPPYGSVMLLRSHQQVSGGIECVHVLFELY